MTRIRPGEASVAIPIAAVALVAAVAGTALAGSGDGARTAGAKKIARKAQQTANQAFTTANTALMKADVSSATKLGYKVVSESTGARSDSPRTIRAGCPSGKTAIGGFGYTYGTNGSYPEGLVFQGTARLYGGVVALATETLPTDEKWSLVAQAVCVNLK